MSYRYKSGSQNGSLVALIVAIAAALVLLAFFIANRRTGFAARTSKEFSRRTIHMQLVEAAGSGDTSKVTKFIDAGIDPNSVSGSGPEGIGALSAAASTGALASVKVLVSRGADVNADDYWGGNPLICACVFGHVEVVKYLLEHGSDPNMNDDSLTALDYASLQLKAAKSTTQKERYQKIVGMLERAGAKNGFFPL